MQKDGPPRQVLTLPARFPQRGPGTAPALQTPLILGPAPREVAARQPHHGPVSMRLGIVALEPQRVLVTRKRLIVPALTKSGRAQVVESHHPTGPELQRSEQVGLRFIQESEVR